MTTSVTLPIYRALVDGRVRGGTAMTLLEMFRREAAKSNNEVATMKVKQYAKALIEDARFFLDERTLKNLQEQSYPSEYDRALIYLAAMPSSHVTLLPPFLKPGN